MLKRHPVQRQPRCSPNLTRSFVKYHLKLFLTMIVRTVAVPIVHMMDAAAEKGNIKQVEMLHIFAVCLQGIA
jgi:hypothetical protein